MEYTLKIGGEYFQVDETNQVQTHKDLYAKYYGAIPCQVFRDSKFLVNHPLSDICFTDPSNKASIRKAINDRIKSIKAELKLIKVSRIKDARLIQIISNLEATLDKITGAGACPEEGQSKADADRKDCAKAKQKLEIIEGILGKPSLEAGNVDLIKTTIIGGGHKSDLTDPKNFLQTVFKLMYVVAHPNQLHAKREWSTVLEKLQDLSLEDMLRGLKEANNNNSNNDSNNDSNNSPLMTENQIQSRLRSVLQLLQTHHYLEDNLDLNAFAKSSSGTGPSPSPSPFTNSLDASIKSKLTKSLKPIWRHYEATYPSLYAFMESQESVPLHSLLLLQEQMECDTKVDKIIQLSEEFNTKQFRDFLKEFTLNYKKEKPENSFVQDTCILLEGRNFRVPDNLEDAIETEIIDKINLKEGKRRQYRKQLPEFFRKFFSRKSLFSVCTQKLDEELNELELNLETDMDSEIFDTIREQLPKLKLSDLGITVHQTATEPLWTDTLFAFCAILAFKKELESIPDGDNNNNSNSNNESNESNEIINNNDSSNSNNSNSNDDESITAEN